MAHLRRGGVALAIAATLITLVSTSDLAAKSAYDQAKLQAYVAAWTSVDRLKGQRKQRIGPTNNREQKIALAKEGDAKIKATIEATPGITIVEFQEITKAAQDDPVLMQRISNIAK